MEATADVESSTAAKDASRALHLEELRNDVLLKDFDAIYCDAKTGRLQEWLLAINVSKLIERVPIGPWARKDDFLLQRFEPIRIAAERRDAEWEANKQQQEHTRSLKAAGLLTLSPIDFSAKAKPRDHLFANHYFRKYVSAIVADGGLGKSSLAIARAIMMATGKQILNDHAPPLRPLRVLFFNGEDGIDELHLRVKATASFYGLSEADFDGRLFVVSGRDMPIKLATLTSSGPEMNEQTIAGLIALIKLHAIDVAIFDPLVKLHSVPENSEAMDKVATAMACIAEKANCGVEFVHHTRKSTMGGEASVEDSRGSSATVDAARSVLRLVKMTKAEAAEAQILNYKAFFRIADSKTNMAGDFVSSDVHKSTWFQIIGYDYIHEDGSVTNVGVCASWSWPSFDDFYTAEDIARSQAAVSLGEYRENPQAEMWAGHAIGTVLGLDTRANADDKKRVKTILTSWTKAGHFKVVRHNDENREKRPFIEVGKPVDE